MPYIINNTSIVTGKTLSIVFITATLGKVRKKSAIIKRSPLLEWEGGRGTVAPLGVKVKVSATDCKVPRSSTVQFYTKKCKNIMDVTKPCHAILLVVQYGVMWPGTDVPF